MKREELKKKQEKNQSSNNIKKFTSPHTKYGVIREQRQNTWLHYH